ncbi:MAG TPA: hypothetical protein VLA88_04095, partial [Candidatus Saccharimonadales bacterium]|nr:hypothetical protein [Candidatus Saccharimonadales bacterium]
MMVTLNGFQRDVLTGIQLGLTDKEISATFGGTGVSKEVRRLCDLFRASGRAEIMFRWLESNAEGDSEEARAAYLLFMRMPEQCRLLLAEMARMCLQCPPRDLGDFRRRLHLRVRELEELRTERHLEHRPPLLVALMEVLSTPNGLGDALTSAAQAAGLKGGGDTHMLKLIRIAYLAVLCELSTPQSIPDEENT